MPCIIIRVQSKDLLIWRFCIEFYLEYIRHVAYWFLQFCYKETYLMSPIFLLLLYLSFRAKHFACDFLLQTEWMALTKGKTGKEGYRALFVHTSIHAVGTLLVMLIFAPNLWWLAVVDFVVHAVIDCVKGRITLAKGLTPKDTFFWWAFGVDQELHNLTHLAYICFIFIALGGHF